MVGERQPQTILRLPYLEKTKIEENPQAPALVNRNEVKNKAHPQKPTAAARAAEAAAVKAYKLETIMALQKALEAGLNEKEKVAPVQPLGSERRTSVRPSPLSAFIQHFWKPIVDGIDRVDQHLKLILTRKKRSRLTSAR